MQKLNLDRSQVSKNIARSISFFAFFCFFPRLRLISTKEPSISAAADIIMKDGFEYISPLVVVRITQHFFFFFHLNGIRRSMKWWWNDGKGREEEGTTEPSQQVRVTPFWFLSVR